MSKKVGTYQGKGDRSAVDEVTCTPAPLREASKKRPIIEA